jgi:hypothetical protein
MSDCGPVLCGMFCHGIGYVAEFCTTNHSTEYLGDRHLWKDADLFQASPEGER